MGFTFKDGLKAHWGSMFVFRGLARRREYILTSLAGLLMMMTLGLFVFIVSVADLIWGFLESERITSVDVLFNAFYVISGGIFVLAYFLWTIGVWLPLGVRRVRDITGSGWWYITIYLAAILATVAGSVFAAFTDNPTDALKGISILFWVAITVFMLAVPSRTTPLTGSSTGSVNLSKVP